MFTVSILTPDKIDARVEKAMAKLNFSVGELNLMYRLFESCDKEGKGLITVEDFFTKILKIRRSYFGDSICDLIGIERPEYLVFGEFITLFTVYCLFESEDILRLCFFMFDKKKTGYVKVEDIRGFIEMLHDGELHSNAEVGMQELHALSDAQGTVNYTKLRVLHRNYPHLLYPAFRMQIQMQRVALGEPWWAAKKKELFLRAEAERQALALEAAEKEKKLERRKQIRGKKKMDALSAISMDVRVRERMGKWMYMLMPWRRDAVAEEIELLDEFIAELGEQAKLDIDR